jgi:hypothetical protein
LGRGDFIFLLGPFGKMLSRAKFRRLCVQMWPPGVTMDGNAMDSLRVAFMRRGVKEDTIRRSIQHVLRGPSGCIRKGDVENAFPELRGASAHDKAEGTEYVDEIAVPIVQERLVADGLIDHKLLVVVECECCPNVRTKTAMTASLLVFVVKLLRSSR